ncbi:hypothetical protein ONE63_002586 [Megalurothrips usitatus]|uniref:tRNA-splicing endonuclease subunit Sen2 n=1 Tax=Megalurothrips usitatus TaxID=439358 RepID=A0AAV7XCC4_9NEOP|nr:hypothetical protein ONE63_002586 [Megalurothrips usitatus]
MAKNERPLMIQVTVLIVFETGIPAHHAIWKSFSGRFNGDCVEVCDVEDISSLYNMGFFGKGSFSRGLPRPARKVQQPEIIRERQWKRRCTWQEESECSVKDGSLEKEYRDESPSQDSDRGTELIVIADTDTEGDDFISHLRPRIENDKNSSPEVLNLLLEEALFLSYGLGCLYIFDTYGQKILSCLEFWSLCVELDNRFIQRYVTYHHFRSKGWVVKSGLKFGGDFLLYKNGPSFFHASYVVRTEVIFGKTDSGTKELDWTTLMGLNRLAETSGKEVLFCYVICPENTMPSHLVSLTMIKKCKVHEVLVRRWQSSVARIDKCSEVKQDVVLDIHSEEDE